MKFGYGENKVTKINYELINVDDFGKTVILNYKICDFYDNTYCRKVGFNVNYDENRIISLAFS